MTVAADFWLSVPCAITHMAVSTSAARFFGIDPARLMPLKERRRYRKQVARAKRDGRRLYRLDRGRHDRWSRP